MVTEINRIEIKEGRLMSKRILIIAPLGQHGGRELEAGFIAQALSGTYDVSVLSTAKYFPNGQILDFDGFSYTSLNEELFRRSRTVRTTIRLASLVKPAISNNSRSLSNSFLKKILNAEKHKVQILKERIRQADLVLICAQVYSNYLDEAIQCSRENDIPVVFRTTGTIFQDERKEALKWVEDVDLFIHHSEANARQLSHRNNSYLIIDQCAYREEELLSIPIQPRTITRYFMLARLTWEKRVGMVIEAFMKEASNATLAIYGDGKEMNMLKDKAAGNENIKFYGQIDQGKIPQVFKEHDCLIIGSSEEAGPLNGIEAMAAGTMVISTRVGAMPERYEEDIWFDGTSEGLVSKISEYGGMSNMEVANFGKRIRQRYIEQYSIEKVREKYLNCLSNVIAPNS